MKIFGIGLNKTGTSTLSACGKSLSLRCAPYSPALIEDAARFDFAALAKTVQHYDLFEDWPWPLLYRWLDETFPGSKFVLTVRKSPEKWLESYKKHSEKIAPLEFSNRLAYGYFYPHGWEEEHIERYKRFNDDVRAYFKDRPNDLLEICWENGDEWEKLCPFLGLDIPEQPFPHANKGSDHKTDFVRYALNRVFAAYCARRKV